MVDADALQGGPGQVDEHAGNARFLKAALCAGFYPCVLRVEHTSNKYAQVAGGAMQVGWRAAGAG